MLNDGRICLPVAVLRQIHHSALRQFSDAETSALGLPHSPLPLSARAFSPTLRLSLASPSREGNPGLPSSLYATTPFIDNYSFLRDVRRLLPRPVYSFLPPHPSRSPTKTLSRFIVPAPLTSLMAITVTLTARQQLAAAHIAAEPQRGRSSAARQQHLFQHLTHR